MEDFFQTFIFEKYELGRESGLVKLHYSLDEREHFCEQFNFGKSFFVSTDFSKKDLDQALFLLHLICGVNYWKTVIPRKMIVRSGEIDPDLKSFCEKLYRQGMSEFIFQNKIDDWQERAEFTVSDFDSNSFWGKNIKKQQDLKPNVLLPIGGGKDSCVSAILLKQAGIDFIPFARTAMGPILETARILGKKLIEVQREIDPYLFEFQKQPGTLKGHIPITAVNSAVALIISIVKGFTHIAFSNERSANEGNIDWQGLQVNHQWAKSLEFEKGFALLAQKFGVKYFSLLRPLSEYHIAKIFTKKGQKFFSIFSSCNKNFQLKKFQIPNSKFQYPIWCGECPKCAFVFAMLLAWLPLEKVINIFGKNLWRDGNLLPLWRDLLGIGEMKPLECVGEAREMACALKRTVDKNQSVDDNSLVYIKKLLDEFWEKYPDFDFGKEEEKLLTCLDEHLLPVEFSDIL